MTMYVIFETADEIANEIKRLVAHLNPTKCESSNNDNDEEDSEGKMLRILGRIFHTQLLLGTLHYHNTREKMMNMINQNFIFKCSAEQILKVAT